MEEYYNLSYEIQDWLFKFFECNNSKINFKNKIKLIYQIIKADGICKILQ